MSTTATAIQPAVGEAGEVEDCPELFQVRGHLYNLVTLRLIEPEDHRFFPMLQDTIARAPDFFRHAPVVLDVAAVAGRPPPNMAEFVRRLRQQRVVPVGVQNGDEAWTQAAINAGLGLFPAGRPADAQRREVPKETPKAEAPAAPSEPPPLAAVGGGTAMVVTEPVRAGQQIHARSGDLVVLAPVSPGAELLAEGHVHVYNSLRGRAHAGISGNTDARIFCHSMHAQLISIAGLYLVNAEIEDRWLGQRVQIRCQDETILMESLP
ncbi:MAG: septum site-determining protein MinC [Pseudomonadota bacterium]